LIGVESGVKYLAAIGTGDIGIVCQPSHRFLELAATLGTIEPEQFDVLSHAPNFTIFAAKAV
jgi:hypothetical protein